MLGFVVVVIVAVCLSTRCSTIALAPVANYFPVTFRYDPLPR